jgi:antitoxin VapB
VAKAARLARMLGLTKTAVLERAIDRLASEVPHATASQPMSAILRQLDQIPDRPAGFDPLEWDSRSLPNTTEVSTTIIEL